MASVAFRLLRPHPDSKGSVHQATSPLQAPTHGPRSLGPPSRRGPCRDHCYWDWVLPAPGLIPRRTKVWCAGQSWLSWLHVGIIWSVSRVPRVAAFLAPFSLPLILSLSLSLSSTFLFLNFHIIFSLSIYITWRVRCSLNEQAFSPLHIISFLACCSRLRNYYIYIVIHIYILVSVLLKWYQMWPCVRVFVRVYVCVSVRDNVRI